MEATFVGEKYDREAAYRPAAEIAKDIRRDLKQAVAEGRLPGAPTKYSVRVDNYSMGRSIDVEIQEWPGVVERTETFEDGHTCRRYTDEAQEVMKVVQQIRQAYNYDRSDVMTDYFDVNFYGSVTFESEFGKEQRMKAREKSRRRRAGEIPTTKRPPKRELVDHVAKHHRRSWNWANTRNYYQLEMAHRFMHEKGRYEFDTDHTHDENEFPAVGR